ncbi:MAG: hypothetical protein HY719_17145 [Planctomycetes bacterium]|nr:hypothetical protein [Planctomycetota bacterium]
MRGPRVVFLTMLVMVAGLGRARGEDAQSVMEGRPDPQEGQQQEGASPDKVKQRGRVSLGFSYDRVEPLKAITIISPNGDAERHYYFLYRITNFVPREPKDLAPAEGGVSSYDVSTQIDVRAITDHRDVVKTVTARKEKADAPEALKTYHNLDNDHVVRVIARKEGFWSILGLQLRALEHKIPWDALLDEAGFPSPEKFRGFADRDPIFGQIGREGLCEKEEDAPKKGVIKGDLKPAGLFRRPVLYGPKWTQRRLGFELMKDGNNKPIPTGQPKRYTQDVVLWDQHYKRTVAAKKGDPIQVVRYERDQYGRIVRPVWKLADPNDPNSRIPKKDRVGLPLRLNLHGQDVPILTPQGRKVYNMATKDWDYQLDYETEMDPLPEYQVATETLYVYDSTTPAADPEKLGDLVDAAGKETGGKPITVEKVVLKPTIRANTQMWCVALFGAMDRFWRELKIEVRGLKNDIFIDDVTRSATRREGEEGHFELDLIEREEYLEITLAREGDEFFRDRDTIRVTNERWVRAKPTRLKED